jgi:hypothetical protein
MGRGCVWCGAEDYKNVFCWSDSQFSTTYWLKTIKYLRGNPSERVNCVNASQDEKVATRRLPRNLAHVHPSHCQQSSRAGPWNSSNCGTVRVVSSSCTCSLVHCYVVVSNTKHAASNDELERDRKKMVVPWFKVLCQHIPTGTQENHKQSVSQDSRYCVPDSNAAPH